MSRLNRVNPCRHTRLMDMDVPADNRAMEPSKPTAESDWTDEQHLAARFRAAMAWAGYPGPQEIGKALGFSTRTATRYLAGEAQKSGSRYTPQFWERVLELTGVPPWFIEHGWAGANVPDEVGVAEKVEALDAQMSVVMSILRGHVTAAISQAVRPQAGREDPEGGEEKGPTL